MNVCSEVEETTKSNMAKLKRSVIDLNQVSFEEIDVELENEVSFEEMVVGLENELLFEEIGIGHENEVPFEGIDVGLRMRCHLKE